RLQTGLFELVQIGRLGGPARLFRLVLGPAEENATGVDLLDCAERNEQVPAQAEEARLDLEDLVPHRRCAGAAADERGVLAVDPRHSCKLVAPDVAHVQVGFEPSEITLLHLTPPCRRTAGRAVDERSPLSG